LEFNIEMSTQTTRLNLTRDAQIGVNPVAKMRNITKPVLVENKPDLSLQKPELFLNRELSWIQYTHRVLEKARRHDTPLLERVKFLAIVSSNIDEFFMKRIGGLKLRQFAGNQAESVDGLTPARALKQCADELLALQRRQEAIYRQVIRELRAHGLEFPSFDELGTQEKDELRTYFIKNIFPLLTPLAIDRSHPFPFISNLSLNLLISMKRPGLSGVLHARVKVPVGGGVPRFLSIGTPTRFVRIEELIVDNIDLLFPKADVISCDVFRVTRNAVIDNDDAVTDDVIAMIQSELHNRKFAPVVRLQTGSAMKQAHRLLLAKELGLDIDNDVLESDSIVCMSDLMEIASIAHPSLRDEPHHPIENTSMSLNESIFDSIRDSGSILLQHPYESFVSSVERFVREASCDPRVAAIKMTLYRTSADTKILQYLTDAARNGKQVAVVVELKARFDEAANVRWAAHLEQAGIHVNYGVLDLKTHCKAILVVRRDADCLRRYAHIGTGNYHAGTARLYSDVGLLTCNTNLTSDLTELFNYLTTGCHPLRNYSQILAAPLMIKMALLSKIQREARQHSAESPGLIRLKTNALEDPDITTALYIASRAGVRVELVVRDICRLRPGLAGVSENIKVVSITGRFLEHSRIYYFRNGGNEEFYIGSADLMTRNLERRVEILVPIEDIDARQALADLLDIQLGDSCFAWEMHPDGTYSQRKQSIDRRLFDSQAHTIEAARERSANAGRIGGFDGWSKTKLTSARIF